MRDIRRQLEEQVLKAVKGFPVVVLTGPRCHALVRSLVLQASKCCPYFCLLST
jgi:hypothetical protein